MTFYTITNQFIIFCFVCFFVFVFVAFFTPYRVVFGMADKQMDPHDNEMIPILPTTG